MDIVHSDYIVYVDERDIRRKTGAFSSLSKEPREKFLTAVTHLIGQTDFTLLSVVIDKFKFKKSSSIEAHIYHLAMQLGLEKVYQFVQTRNQQNRLMDILFEARGRTEDIALERVCCITPLQQAA